MWTSCPLHGLTFYFPICASLLPHVQSQGKYLRISEDIHGNRRSSGEAETMTAPIVPNESNAELVSSTSPKTHITGNILFLLNRDRLRALRRTDPMLHRCFPWVVSENDSLVHQWSSSVAADVNRRVVKQMVVPLWKITASCVVSITSIWEPAWSSRIALAELTTQSAISLVNFHHFKQ